MKEITCQNCNSVLELSDEQLASTRSVYNCPVCQSKIHKPVESTTPVIKTVKCKLCKFEFSTNVDSKVNGLTCPMCKVSIPDNQDLTQISYQSLTCKSQNCNEPVFVEGKYCVKCETKSTYIGCGILILASLMFMIVCNAKYSKNRKSDEQIRQELEEYDQRKYNEKRDKEKLREWKYQNGIP